MKGLKKTNKSFKTKVDISTNFKTNQQFEQKKTFESYFNFFSSSFKTLKFYDIDRVRNFEDIPQKNDVAFIMTRKNINSFEILEHIDSKYKIEKLHVSFNVINEVGYRELVKYNVETIFTRFDYKEKIKTFKRIYKSLEDKVIEQNQHTKLILAKCEDNNYIVVNSSTNPALSSRNESYIIFNDKIIYDNFLEFLTIRQNKFETKILLPKNNEIFNFVARNDKTIFDVIKEIEPSEIKKIYLIQYSTNFQNMQEFRDYCKTHKINYFAYFSKRIFDMNPHQVDKINILFPQMLYGDTTHCKMFLIQTKENYYITVSTANYFSNNKFEATAILNNKMLFENIVNFSNDFFKN